MGGTPHHTTPVAFGSRFLYLLCVIDFLLPFVFGSWFVSCSVCYSFWVNVLVCFFFLCPCACFLGCNRCFYFYMT